MKTPKSKRKMITLPQDYQEILILHEMQFEKDINIDVIRKLVYLYSVENNLTFKLGMEYYDSINRSELHKFYMDKSNKLLMNPKVIETLDANTVDLSNNTDIKLFPVDPYQIVNKKVNFSSAGERKIQPRRSLSGSDFSLKNAYTPDAKRLEKHKTVTNLHRKVSYY